MYAIYRRGFLNIDVYPTDKFLERGKLEAISSGSSQIPLTLKIDDNQKIDIEVILKDYPLKNIDMGIEHSIGYLISLSRRHSESFFCEESIYEITGGRGIQFGIGIDRLQIVYQPSIDGNNKSKKFNPLHHLNL